MTRNTGCKTKRFQIVFRYSSLYSVSKLQFFQATLHFVAVFQNLLSKNQLLIPEMHPSKNSLILLLLRVIAKIYTNKKTFY